MIERLPTPWGLVRLGVAPDHPQHQAVSRAFEKIARSGPAAFYAAAPLLASEDPVVEVDMIERLPTPWGLVRLGVAPDHPQLKTVSRAFEKIAARPGFRFLGNVEVGRDVTHEELTSAYDAVVYAVGSQTDRQLGIPGEELPGSWAATELVAWYNGHPDFQHLDFDLSHERAVVIGNGNVALDVARMLALTAEELAPTDTTDAAIDAIVASGIREIVVLGRRGPVQAAWTSTELGELGELAGADVVVDPAELELDPASAGRARRRRSNIVQRNVEILREFAHAPTVGQAARRAASVPHLTGRDPRRRTTSRVSRSSATASSRTSVVRCAPCRPTSARSSRAGSCFAASATAASGFPGSRSTSGAGRIPNDEGRVLGEDGSPIPGLYCAGWIKRGPTGVIGTNKKDATETVEHLLEDARAGRLPSATTDASIDELLVERGVDVVAYAGWEAIDAAERTHGETQGRPRVKLCSWDELLAAARSG